MSYHWSKYVWTVEAKDPRPGAEWTIWLSWVDRATAEAEKRQARAEGYLARIVRAS
jgi:hypothetical protein